MYVWTYVRIADCRADPLDDFHKTLALLLDAPALLCEALLLLQKHGDLLLLFEHNIREAQALLVGRIGTITGRIAWRSARVVGEAGGVEAEQG